MRCHPARMVTPDRARLFIVPALALLGQAMLFAAPGGDQVNPSTAGAARHRSEAEWDTLRAQRREENAIAAEVQAADRKDLVLPPPRGFKPAPEAKKLQLTLRLRDKTIKKGERIWYRLELRNVGSKSVRIHETHSFLKKPSGSYSFTWWDFFVTLPDGKKKRVAWGDSIEMQGMSHLPQRPVDIPGSEHMTKEQLDDFMRRDQARRKAERDMDLELAPGEAVASRPWRWVGDEEYLDRYQRGEAELRPKPSGDYAEFFSSFKFSEAGKYGFQVVIRDEAVAINEQTIKRFEGYGSSREETIRLLKDDRKRRLGVVASNVADFTVGP